MPNPGSVAGGNAKYQKYGSVGMSLMGRMPCAEGKRRGRPTNEEALAKANLLARLARANSRPGRPSKKEVTVRVGSPGDLA